MRQKKFTKAFLYYVIIYCNRLYKKFKYYLSSDYSLIDFIQDGNIILIDLIYKNKYTQLSLFNYALYGALHNKIESIVDKNRYYINYVELTKVLDIIKKYYHENKEIISYEELLELTKMEENRLNDILEYIENNQYLASDANIFFEDEIIDKINQEELKAEINNFLYEITGRKKDIIVLYYELNNHEKMSLKKIAQYYHTSKQNVGNIKNKVLLEMKKIKN